MSPLPAPLVPPLDDEQKLIQLISQVSDKSVAWVRDGLQKEEQCLGHFMRTGFEQWKLKPHVWDDRLIDFYRHGDSELMGYVVWNRRQEKRTMRTWIGQHLQRTTNKPISILTIGDGAGFDSLYLSLCGHNVIFSEESESCLQFAETIFEQANRPLTIVNGIREIDRNSVDMIVCLDVLEHVPDPPAFVGELAARLRPGGRLIVHAPFFFVTWHNPTHLRSNIRYSGALNSLYTLNGLELIDGRTLWDPIVLKKCAPGETPQRNPITIARLRIGGWLLATARVWNGPHNWIASRIMQRPV
jgi:SAM-dependent methyltransferase